MASVPGAYDFQVKQGGSWSESITWTKIGRAHV